MSTHSDLIYVYPGSFCPPTFGHFEVVKMAAQAVDHLIIVCSAGNPDKKNWFTEVECVELWSCYDLPANVEVTTFEQIAMRQIDMSNIVMVRGIRGPEDFEGEADAIRINFERLGIDKYMYFVTGPKFKDVSSTRAREFATKRAVDQLKLLVPSPVATLMLARVEQESSKESEVDWLTQKLERSRNSFHPFSYRKRRHVIKQFD